MNKTTYAAHFWVVVDQHRILVDASDNATTKKTVVEEVERAFAPDSVTVHFMRCRKQAKWELHDGPFYNVCFVNYLAIADCTREVEAYSRRQVEAAIRRTVEKQFGYENRLTAEDMADGMMPGKSPVVYIKVMTCKKKKVA